MTVCQNFDLADWQGADHDQRRPERLGSKATWKYAFAEALPAKSFTFQVTIRVRSSYVTLPAGMTAPVKRTYDGKVTTACAPAIGFTEFTAESSIV